jgi:hypothetical protein
MLTVLLGSVAILAGDSPATAGGDLSLEVRVVGAGGKRVEKSSMTLWRLVPGRGPLEEAGARHPDRLREAATGRVWEPIGSVATDDRWRRDDLAPGTYRATVRLGHNEPTPIAVSEVVVLNGRRKSAVLVVRLKPGPAVSFRLVDAASNQPVPGGQVSLIRQDVEAPLQVSWTTRGSDDQGRITIDQLAAGTYTLSATRRASCPEELEYSAVEERRTLVVSEGVDQVVRVAMAGRSLTQAQIEERWGWVATGTVVDDSGLPVAGAEVRVATGMYTLPGGGATTTGGDGRFTLRFSEGIWSQDEANPQAAIFMVAKEGYLERSRSRPGLHMMARKVPRASSYRLVEPDKIILKGRPYRIDFVLAEPATIEVELRGPADAPPDVAGPDEWARRNSARQDAPNRWTLLPGQPWRFTLPYRKTRFSVRSLPFTLPRAGRYRAVLRFTPDPEDGVDLLEILGVTGSDGREIRDRVVGDDPTARPPVPEALQQQGRDLLRRMAEANRPWLGPPPEGARTYEYRFRVGEQEGQAFWIGEAPVSRAVRRGISHASAVHHLAAYPAAAVFRQVQVRDDRIVLAYTLKAPIGVSAGNGVQGNWHGFFSMPMLEGVLVLDARRLTPLENRSEALDERFSQYVEVDQGHFAPLAIRIEQGAMRFDWTFQVVAPKLWLFATSEPGPGESVVRVDRVRVNGADATVIARGERLAGGLD